MRLPIGDPALLAHRPAWFRAILQAYDVLAAASPSPAVRAAYRLGKWACRARLYGPSPDDITALVGRPVSRAIAREITGRDCVNRAFDRLLLSDGYHTVEKLVAEGCADADGAVRPGDQAGPVVFGAWHGGGPTSAISVVLARRGVRAYVIRVTSGGVRPTCLEVDGTGWEGEDSAVVLRRAVDHLRGGRSVVLAVDGLVGTCVGPVSCLGRQARFRRGAFMLSRVCGVPIVPVVSRWRGGAVPIEVRIFPAIPPPPAAAGAEGEREQAGRFARWLEERLRRHPEEISLPFLTLLDDPRPPETAAPCV